MSICVFSFIWEPQDESEKYSRSKDDASKSYYHLYIFHQYIDQDKRNSGWKSNRKISICVFSFIWEPQDQSREYYDATSKDQHSSKISKTSS